MVKVAGRSLETAIYLNDKYSLDGRDPNGYADGMGYCRFARSRLEERPVFGKIRYMNHMVVSENLMSENIL